MTVRDSSKPMLLAMIGFAAAALIAFLATLPPFHSLSSSAPPIIHVIMAIGIMPLIMGAMIYFTPVLIRTRTPSWPMLLVPVVALMAGMMVTSSLVWRRDLLFIPAVLAISTAGAMLAWMWRRTRTMLGRPHLPDSTGTLGPWSACYGDWWRLLLRRNGRNTGPP